MYIVVKKKPEENASGFFYFKVKKLTKNKPTKKFNKG